MAKALSVGSVHPRSKEVAVLEMRKGDSGVLGVPVYKCSVEVRIWKSRHKTIMFCITSVL